jgi:hypothetical protein
MTWALAGSLVLLVAFQFLQIALGTALLRETEGELALGASVRISSISLLTRYGPAQVLMAVTRVTMVAARGVPRSIAAASLAYEIPLAVGSAFALSVAFLIDLPELEHHGWRWLMLPAPVVLLWLLHPGRTGRRAPPRWRPSCPARSPSLPQWGSGWRRRWSSSATRRRRSWCTGGARDPDDLSAPRR